MAFHQDSQGLHLLDRYLGKLFATPENLSNRVFGLQFASYIEWCQTQAVAPRGRVFISMVILRFRLQKARQMHERGAPSLYPAGVLQESRRAILR